MAEIVTFELPEALAKQVRDFAALTHRRLEDVLVEWIDRAIADLPIEALPDEQVLALCDSQLEINQQEVLSELLARNQAGELSDVETSQLDELMRVYRKGLVREARALKVAIERGLKSRLGE